MTTITRPSARPIAPEIHALVIGVSAYRHLACGTERNRRLDFCSSQLTSAHHSARAFATWLLQGLRHPSAGLATVELLLSEPGSAPASFTEPATGNAVMVDRATFANVKDAFIRWSQRLDSPQHVGIFYFCGHGVMRGNLALLLEDFGARADAPFDGALDFQRNQLGMNRCAAREQYYFVDACHKLSSLAGDQLEDEAQVLLRPRVNGESGRRGATFYGASERTAAYGTRNELTHYTRALLAGLAGLGSEPNAHLLWQVTPTLLTRAVQKELEHAHPTMKIDRQLTSAFNWGDDPFHVVGDPPDVPVNVSCDPEHAAVDTELRVWSDRSHVISKGPARHGWEVPLKPDTYDFATTFPRGSDTTRKQRFPVNPPRKAIVLRV